MSAFLVSLFFAAVALAGPVRLSTISVSPGAVVGGTAATGTATLTSAAGHGGAVVTLTSSNTAAATVPASITVPQGAVSATFPVSTSPVNASTGVTITGNLGVNATASFTVTPPAVSGLSIAPSSFTAVTGSATGTVTLNGAAAAGGGVVTLTHTGSFVTMPGSVTVPAGATSATFTMTASQITTTTTVTVTATANGNSAVANVDVTPCAMGTIGATLNGSSTDIVWFDDALPAGMSLGTAQWSAAQHASGTQSLTTSSGSFSFQLTGATTPFQLNPAEQFYAYVLPNLCSPPREIMIGFHTTTGQWKKAYVGAALIGGEASAYYAGPLPAAGAWGQIAATAQQLGVASGAQFDGFSLELSDGQVWIDRVTKTCHQPLAAAPSLPAGDTYWIDDSFPSGTPGSQTTWDTAQHAAGTQALYQNAVVGGMNPGMQLYIGEKLIAYVLLDYCAPGSEMHITWTSWYGEVKGAYWGTATPGDAGYVNMGAMPSPGQWVRLEVPAAALGLEERWITGINAYANGWWDLLGKAGQGCSFPTAAAPSIPAGDTLALEDSGGAVQNGGTWTVQQHASGTQSLTIPYSGQTAGDHWLGVTSFPPPYVTPVVGETLVFYALLDPCAPPTELAVQFNYDPAGQRIKGMYWGTPHGIENGFVYIGPLPDAGSWQRFEVPAINVNAAWETLNGVKFEWWDGNAYFDHIGKGGTPCVMPLKAAPTNLPSTDEIWVDDSLPYGTNGGGFDFTPIQHASGQYSFRQAYGTGLRGTSFTFVVNQYPIGRGDLLTFYVLLDECTPPTELIATWRGNHVTDPYVGVWWGTPHNLGEGGPNMISMGALPAPGVWTRVDISAAALGLEGNSVSNVSLSSYDGQTFWDRLGRVPCLMPAAAAPTFPAGDTVWIDDNVPPGANDVAWSTAQHAQGTRSIGNATASNGTVQIGIDGINPHLPVYVGERLVMYALVDSCPTNPTTSGITLYASTSLGEWVAAYWGARSGLEPSGAVSMGALPAVGQWTRLEVPLSALHIEQREITHLVLQYTGGRVWFDHIGKAGTGCITANAAPPSSFPSGDTVWVDDNQPSGWTAPQFDTTQAASGTRSIGGSYAEGSFQSFTTAANGAATLPVYVGEKFVFYALIDECAPPREIALMIRTTAQEYTGAYWGARSGREPASAVAMGSLPAGGQWVRYEVPASLLRVEERQIDSIDLWLDGGHVWFDRIGKGGAGCITATAPQPSSFPSGDTVWVDDNQPTGWTAPAGWDTAQAASGTRSIGSWYAQGDFQSFTTAANGGATLPVYVGEKFVFYALIDECAPPREIALMVRTTAQEYTGAYWGTASGREPGSAVSMGSLPAGGQWVRYEIPASLLRVEERQIDSIDFWADGGHVWFDRVGKGGAACITATAPAPSFPSGDTVWVDDNEPSGWTAPAGWDTAQAASGTRSIGGWYPQGNFQSFTMAANGGATLPVYVGEKFVFYALVDECAPPREIALMVRTTAQEYTGAYWGTASGREPGSAVAMGAVGAGGQWVRYEVPASSLHVEERQIDSIDLWADGGHVWFDRIGKSGTACITATAPPPSSFRSADTVWVDDNQPTGWTAPAGWDTAQAASGTRSIGGWYSQGNFQSFNTAANGGPTLGVAAAETFVFYALIDECAPPREIAFFVRTTDQEYRGAYWGTAGGREGSAVSMGALPAGGQWVRFEVPMSALGLTGPDRQIDSIDLWAEGGHVWYDRVGKTQ